METQDHLAWPEPAPRIPTRRWHSKANRFTVEIDPKDSTHYVVRENGREAMLFRGAVPSSEDAHDPAAHIERSIVHSFGLRDDGELPVGLGNDDFVRWAEAAQSEADAEYTRRVVEHEQQLASDGWERGSNITPRKIDFLLKPYIPIGYPTLLAGDPGIGKSKVSLALAAGVTRGVYGAVRDALIMSVEDDHEASIAPMLIKLGADMDRVHILPIEKAFVLDDDGFAKLDRALATFDPLLVIIDPMTFFLGGKVDMHRANEVRAVMKELGARAAKHRNVFLPIIHVNKGQQKMLYKILGSIDFSASVRSVLAAGMVEDEPERGRVLVHVKTNAAKLGDPLGFDLTEDPADPDGAPVFAWRDTDITKAELEGNSRPGRSPSQIKIARSIIIALLKNGPQPGSTVKDAVVGAGVSEATLRRARAELVEIDRDFPGGGGSKSMWRLKPLAAAQTGAPEWVRDMEAQNEHI